MSRGFTLVEVLVALFVAAVALTAAGRAVGLSVDGAAAARERTLALWVAKDRLAERQSEPAVPGIGRQSGRVLQGGVAFVWQEEASATPNPRFRLLRVRVAGAERPDYTLASLSGYLVR